MAQRQGVFCNTWHIALSLKWEQSSAEVMGWIRARLALVILHATGMCVRGSCAKWRSTGLDDGAAITLDYIIDLFVFILCVYNYA